MTLAMTKLIVADIEKAKAFYAKVCGLKEANRIQGIVEGRKMTEIIMAPEDGGTPSLVLFAYHDAKQPRTEECMLVFETTDVEGFVARALEAGGSIMEPVRDLPEFGLTFALVRDSEGHVLEPLHRFDPGKL